MKYAQIESVCIFQTLSFLYDTGIIKLIVQKINWFIYIIILNIHILTTTTTNNSRSSSDSSSSSSSSSRNNNNNFKISDISHQL